MLLFSSFFSFSCFCLKLVQQWHFDHITLTSDKEKKAQYLHKEFMTDLFVRLKADWSYCRYFAEKKIVTLHFLTLANVRHLFLIQPVLFSLQLFLSWFLPLTTQPTPWFLLSQSPSLCRSSEINFTLHYQSESLQTQTHGRNHTNRLYTLFQWACPPHLHICFNANARAHCAHTVCKTTQIKTISLRVMPSL